MGKVCFVKSCPTGRNSKHGVPKDTSFFKPTSQARLEKWRSALGSKLLKKHYVCHFHFKEEDIKTYEKIIINGEVKLFPTGRKMVRDEAVPTIEHQFVPIPNYKLLQIPVRYLPKPLSNDSGDEQENGLQSNLETIQEMPICAAEGCSNSSTKGFIMRYFPKDPQLRHEWKTNIGRDNWYPTDSSVLCEVHFAPLMWQKTRNGLKKLRKNAVPTLFTGKEKIAKTKLPLKNNSTDNVKKTNMSNNDVVYISDSENSDFETPSSPASNHMDVENEDIAEDGDANESTDTPKMCRMCMKRDIPDAKNIFEDYLEEDVSIRSAVESCIYSLEDSIDDPLSKFACVECLELLSSFYNFKMFVLSQDRAQREFFASDPLDTREVLKGQKRSVDTSDESELTKRRKTKCSSDKSQLTMSFGQVETITETESVPALRPGTLRIYNNSVSADQDEAASNSSDENDTCSQQVTVNKGMDNDLSSITHADDEVSNQKLGSSTTISNESLTFYMTKPFCIVDGYLMEHKLLKGNIRYLRCASAKCSAIGKQEIITPDTFKNIAIISKSHNHKKPTPDEIEKLKIISAVRKQVQNSRGSSIKSIYEEFCKIDSTITQLVPIENLMEEICNL